MLCVCVLCRRPRERSRGIWAPLVVQDVGLLQLGGAAETALSARGLLPGYQSPGEHWAQQEGKVLFNDFKLHVLSFLVSRPHQGFCFVLQSMYSRVPECQITTYYYVGFAYLMMRRYQDAIRVFANILLYIQRTRNMFQRSTYKYEMVSQSSASLIMWEVNHQFEKFCFIFTT